MKPIPKAKRAQVFSQALYKNPPQTITPAADFQLALPSVN
jgi:hypothetical protein